MDRDVVFKIWSACRIVDDSYFGILLVSSVLRRIRKVPAKGASPATSANAKSKENWPLERKVQGEAACVQRQYVNAAKSDDAGDETRSTIEVNWRRQMQGG